MPTRSSKPRDANQAAKHILDQLTGDAPKEEPPPVKKAAAVALGKLGGKKGGAARAAKLTPEQRSEIAKKAAAGRWKTDARTTPLEAEASAPQVDLPKGKRRIRF
jgi:hypothetical protein